MDTQQLLGFGLILAGAICGGSFGLPSKFAPKDTPWEVLWGPFFFFVTILIPVVVAPLVVEDLGDIYSRVGFQAILPVLVFGLLWGLGSMTLGMSFAFIGLSLAYALNYGAQIIFGSMMPMALFEADQILTTHGGVILAGVAVCVIGVIVSGRAAILKDRSLKAEPLEPETPDSKNPKMLTGVIIAILSGLLCACYSVAYGYGGEIGKVATAANSGQGTAWAAFAATWAITAMILWGGAISSCLYCIVQLTRNKTWGKLAGAGAGRVLLMAAAMAVLHDAAIFFFGLGAIKLGNLGLPIGYPVFMSLAIIVGNVHGFRTGEWKGASRQSIAWIIAGIALLIVGVCVLGAGKGITPTPS